MLISLFPCFLYAIENDRHMDIEIKFSQTNLTVKQALEEIGKLPGISIVYNEHESFMNLPIILPKDSITVKESLEIIKKHDLIDK